jgi:hypothetical protein
LWNVRCYLICGRIKEMAKKRKGEDWLDDEPWEDEDESRADEHQEDEDSNDKDEEYGDEYEEEGDN